MGQLHILQQVLLNQEAVVCGLQTIEAVFRNLIEPVLRCKEESVVLVKVEHSQSYENLLKRINFVNPNIFSFGKGMNFLKQFTPNRAWGESQFLAILSPRYSALLVWNNDLSRELGNENGMTIAYSVINSKIVSEIIKSIVETSDLQLDGCLSSYNPERRANEVMNAAYNGLIRTIDTINTEFALTIAEKNTVDLKMFEKYESSFKKTSAVCHEIRNHLSIVDLYSKIIEKKSQQSSGEKNEDVCFSAASIIQKSLFSISFLLNSLKNDETKIENLNLGSILENVLKMAKPRLDEKRIEIMLDVEKKINVLVDEIKFQNVLLNLIYNAIDALEEKGQIELSLKVEDEFVKLVVKDNGKGICQSIKEQLFKPCTTTKINGNGLGLNICKENLNSMNSDIRLVESDETGTAFEISVLKGSEA